MEWLEEDDVRKICEAVFSGNFEETIWSVDSEVTTTKGRVYLGGKVLRMTHWFSSFYPFRKKEKKFVRYAPYTDHAGALNSAEATHAL